MVVQVKRGKMQIDSRLKIYVTSEKRDVGTKGVCKTVNLQWIKAHFETATGEIFRVCPWQRSGEQLNLWTFKHPNGAG